MANVNSCGDPSDTREYAEQPRDGVPPSITPGERVCPVCQTPLGEDDTSCPSCKTLVLLPGVHPPTPERLPEVQGYQVLEKLGTGGMGVVYRLGQTSLNREVALKMILDDRGRTPEWRSRFQQEAEALALLKHPHIVQVYERGEHESQPYFAMELVEGADLRKNLQSGPWAPHEAAALIETLARAVQVAHTHGLVHRDLKPANVLLTADGTPKITDFGLARRLDRAEPLFASAEGIPDQSAGVGTPLYMAPEQARALLAQLGVNESLAPAPQGEIGPATDVHALGSILHELLTGRPPFSAATVVETLQQVIRKAPVPLAQLQPRTPRDLEAICRKCLEKEPARRYASALELAEDLDRFRQSKETTARPLGSAGRAVYWVKRRPVVAGLIAAVAAALVLGTVVATIFALEAIEARKAEARRADTEAAARGEAQLQADRFKKATEILLGYAFEQTLTIRELLDSGKVEAAELASQSLVDSLREVYDVNPSDEKLRENLAQAQGLLAWAELLAGHFDRALQDARRATHQAPHREDIGINLAHAYLLTNSYARAEAMYRTYKDIPFGKRKRTCAEVVREDFQAFRKRNLGDAQVQANMRKVEALLKGRAD